VINVDKQKLQSAPSFEAGNWPDFSNKEWKTKVHKFYNVPASWETSSYESSSSFSEPAGAEVMVEPSGASTSTYSSRSSSSYSSHSSYGSDADSTADQIDAEGDRVLHLYQRGKHSADFTDRQLKEKGHPVVIIPGQGSSYSTAEFHSDRTMMDEAAGAEKRYEAKSDTHIKGDTHIKTESHTKGMKGSAMTGGFYRASDLMGMNVKNTQGETVGEIKDFAIDPQSGRIAYTMISAGGFLGVGDKWVAVPPTLLTPAGDKKVTLNVDRQKLSAAPTFDRDNWDAASDQAYVTKIYSHYGQQPYWRASTTVREPSGAELNIDKSESDVDVDVDADVNKSEVDVDVNEPSGAELNIQRDDQSYQQDKQDSGRSDTDFRDHEAKEEWDSGLDKPDSSDAQGSIDLRSDSTAGQRGAELLREPAGASTDADVDVDADTGFKADASIQADAPERSVSEPAGAQSDASASATLQSSETSTTQSAQQSQDQSSASAGFQSQSQSSDTQSQSLLSDPAGSSTSSESSVSTSDTSKDDAAQADASISAQSSESSSVQSEPAGAEASASAQADQSQSSSTQSQDAASAQSQSQLNSDTSSASTSEQSEVTSEAAGAATGSADQKLLQNVRSSLQSQTGASNVQVSSENGKICLKGTVQSESEKQQILEKVKGMIIDDQIQVRSGSQQNP